VIQARRILVPVNGNPTDPEAIALACDIGKRNKAEVYAIYVIEVKRTLPLEVDLPPEAAKGDAVLAQAERVARDWSLHLQCEILQARDVGTAIVDEALERQCDLVIMGITYKRKFGEFDLGKTAPYVLKNAPCPVWLVRAAPPAGPQGGAETPAGAHAHRSE
jgi:nucleotide-binding universal stress UspA family protein